jgi:catechol 2,3-dioxygenase-like lactoylglutathione lyase family enzyme
MSDLTGGRQGAEDPSSVGRPTEPGQYKGNLRFPGPSTHLRVARPTRDLALARTFWCDGLGLDVIWAESEPAPGHHALVMLGWPGAAWHLELVADRASAEHSPPGAEDLLVIYLGGEVPPELVDRLQANGGRRVPAKNPYWDQWGVTLADPDGYRLVLSTRAWS